MIIFEDFNIAYGDFNISYPDIHIRKNEFVGLYGESGCGKTSLLEALFGIDFPGRIQYSKCTINGRDLETLGTDKYNVISYCPQFSQNAFNPKLTVMEHIELTIKGNGLEYKEEGIQGLMDGLGLDSRLLASYPYMLSGGQKQRFILLLSMLKKPKILVLDEPSSALDLITLRKISEFLLSFKNQVTIIMVAHQRVLLDRLADRQIKIEGYSSVRS